MLEVEKLKLMLEEEEKFDSNLYSAGPYWRGKTKKIVKEISRKGVLGFRGYDSGVGTSYCDNVVTDLRNEISHGVRGFGSFLGSFFPLAPGFHLAFFMGGYIFGNTVKTREFA